MGEPIRLPHWRQPLRTAFTIDRILKDAKPADVAVEQPIKYELVINQNMARWVGPHDPAITAVGRGDHSQAVNLR